MRLSKSSRPETEATDDSDADRRPRALLVAVFSWVVLAIALVFSGAGSPTPTDQNRETMSAIDTLNETQIVAPTGQQSPWFPYLWVLGAVVVVMALLLAFRQGWTRIVLAMLGAVGIVALAMAGSWLTVPAVLATVVGSICVLLPEVHRYLNRERPATAAPRIR